MSEADLTGTNLTWAALIGIILIDATVEQARFIETIVHGVSAWNLRGTPAIQRDLEVGRRLDKNLLTVDDIELAQFIYLLLRNEKIRDVIDSITSKVVLILGRFTPERKELLDEIRTTLRQYDLVPILFDTAGPATKDDTGTVETLARMARFVIADLTEPRSVPHELATIVPLLRTTPVIPIKQAGSTGYSMFRDLRHYPWVLEVHEYESSETFSCRFADTIIVPAESKRTELLRAASTSSE